MHARAPVLAKAKHVASGQSMVIKIKRGGTGGTGGSGPTGYKATPRALLSRHLADRAGAAAATTARQAAIVEAKKHPRKIIWPDK